MLLVPKSGIIYGPVRSRRLGRSLGINLLPPSRKTCSFNCRYCQYGWSGDPSKDHDGKKDYPETVTVLTAVIDFLEKHHEPLAAITFSGNGEPTLHPDFKEIVEGIIRLRDRMAGKVGVAVLSNSSHAENEKIYEALDLLDCRIMKLDCGDSRTFRKFNQPANGITLDQITRGLKRLSSVTIQALFCQGETGNMSPANIRNWTARIKRINPESVQLYSLDRSSPDPLLKPAEKKALQRIAFLLRDKGIPASVY